MAYTAPQIGVILLKADRTMYKIGQIAYENMFAEDNEALDYERDVIFIYKKAVEFADDFFVGTEKLDKVVERLATKISAYDYGELNPIYADAATVNIPSVVAGAALNDLTDVTIANLLDNQFLRYNAATGQWINVGPGSAVRSSQAFIATAGQTVFTTSAPFDAGLFDLYVNGVKLNSLSYTTFGEYQITLNDPCAAGDIVDVVIYDPNTGINPTANTLNDLTDVNIGPLANKQALYYNSASGLWENGLVFVPYTGATAAVDLGEFEIRAGQFTLDTSPTGTATVGTTRWNDNIGSSETTLKGGSVILKNGVDLVARVVNKVTPNTTLTKASYAAVRISGAQGQRLAVAYAQANNDANSADTIGLVTETIATNQEGFIMTMGNLEGINTTGSLQGETWADGDVLYLSPTVPGGITNVKPTGLTGHIVVVGYVEYAHANNGKIYVKTMNGWELDELHNVNINIGTLANGDVLKYNATTQLWENGVDAGGITGTGVAGQVPYFTGASAVAGSNNLFWDAANSRLGIGTNTPTESLHVPGQVRIGSTVNGYLFNSNTITTYGNIFWGIQSDRSFQITDHTYASTYLRINRATGNTSLGSSADAGQRLQVYGDTLLRGSGNTNSTLVLTAQNSDSANVLRVFNGGSIGIGSSADRPIIFPFTTGVGSPVISGTNLAFYNYTNTQSAANGAFGFENTAAAQTSGQNSFMRLSAAFVPTSGTGAYTQLLITGTINQTGGANGITRGLHITPTLTAATDFRAIETSAGNVLFGSNFTWNNTSNRLELNGIDSGDSIRIINRGFITFSDTTNALTSRFRGISAGFVFQDAAFNTRAQISTGAGLTYFNAAGGGVMIGTSTDLGVRLGVSGDTILRGSGSIVLDIQNSSSVSLAQFRSDSRITLGGKVDIGLTNTVFNAYSDTFNTLGIIPSASWTAEGTGIWFFDRAASSTGGTLRQIRLGGIGSGFAPTSGNATHTHLEINSTINQTGTANGITRGLYVNPTLTAAVDFRAIETSNNTGWAFYGAGTAPSQLGGALTVTGGLTLTSGILSLPTAIHSVFSGAYRFWLQGFTRWAFDALSAGLGYQFKHTVASGNAFNIIDSSNVSQLLVTGVGNTLLGSSTDTGQRLQVTGDTFLKGSGNTSATTALTVQNSDGTNLIRAGNNNAVTVTNLVVSNTGGTTLSMPGNNYFYHDAVGSQGRLAFYAQGSLKIVFGSSGNGITINPSSAAVNELSGEINVAQRTLRNVAIYAASVASAISGGNTAGTFTANGTVGFDPTNNHAGGHLIGMYSAETFNPNNTLKDVNYSAARLSPIINQTGGAVAITRGLYIDPTLTAAANFRAIETTTGNVLFGSNFFWDNANSRLGIGTNTPGVNVDIVGLSTGVGNAYLRVQRANNTTADACFITQPQGTLSASNVSWNYGLLGGSNNFRFWYFNGTTPITALNITNTGNVHIGSGADATVRLQVSGDTLLRGSGDTSATTALTVQNSSSTNLFTVRNDGLATFGGSILVSLNQNAGTSINISNTTSGNTSNASLQLTSDVSSGSGFYGKRSSTTTNYKILEASNLQIYNGLTAGDIAILNDFASGTIKFAAGGSSTAHLTIKSNGRINMSSLPTSSTGLVAGDLWNDAGTVKIV